MQGTLKSYLKVNDLFIHHKLIYYSLNVFYFVMGIAPDLLCLFFLSCIFLLYFKLCLTFHAFLLQNFSFSASLFMESAPDFFFLLSVCHSSFMCFPPPCCLLSLSIFTCFAPEFFFFYFLFLSPHWTSMLYFSWERCNECESASDKYRTMVSLLL